MTEHNDALGNLPREAVPPVHLKARVLRDLASRGLVRRRARPWGSIAALLVAAAAGFSAGMVVTRPAQPGGSRFVLLLYEDAAFQMGDPREFVAEYRAWGERARTAGRLVGGERLAESAFLLVHGSGGVDVAARDIRSEGGALAGYFVVSARDYSEAVALARTHPHLSHGGRIAVRMIEPT